jgi:hypothetical protein
MACLVPSVDVTEAKFPSSFYAIDVHRAFTFKLMNQVTVKVQFQHLFQLPWKSSTFYNYRTQWLNTPHDARDRAIAAGYSDAGHYRLFLAAHPAKDADIKAAKRKLQVSQCN